MNYLIALALFVFQAAADDKPTTPYLDCSDLVSLGKTVDYYPVSGDVVPRNIVCPSCGGEDLNVMGPNDPRLRYTGGERPESLGQTVAVHCSGCAHNYTLLDERGERVADPNSLEIHEDGTGKRYIKIPEHYLASELRQAIPDSDFTDRIKSQLIAVCESCGTNHYVESAAGLPVNCVNCGDQVTESMVINTRNLSAPVIASPLTPPPRAATPPSAPNRFRVNPKFVGLAFGAAFAVGTTTYIATNDAIVTSGTVVNVEENLATVEYSVNPLSAEKEIVFVALSARDTLPGEDLVPIEVGDPVDVHAMSNDLRFLYMIFHPYTGAEFPENGMIVPPEGISR